MSNMAENMDNEPKASLWEENEAPTLAKLKKNNPFTVPADYFEELGERINQAVFVSALKENTTAGFSTPANYFETLENQISARIVLTQYEHSQHQGFSVPAGYFEKLHLNIEAKTTSARKTRKLWQQPIFRYAVAASLTLIATTGWFVNNKYQQTQLRHTELANEQMLYDIDESVVLEYVQESQNVKTASVTNGEMEDYILDNFSASDLSNNL